MTTIVTSGAHASDATPVNITTHVTLPPERFFWAVLDTSSLPARRRHDAHSLGYLFENVLPLPIELVHAAYTNLDDGRVLSCGLARNDLEAVVGEQPGVLALYPQSIPEFVGANGHSAQRLNLLTGDFEPLPLRRAKRGRAVQVAAAFLLSVGLLILGLERRISSEHAQIARLREARLATIQQAIGDSAIASGNQPPELRFLAELRILRQTRQQQQPSDSANSPINAALTLAALVQHWPADLHVLAESVSITATSVTLRAAAPSSGDVQTLADALDLGAGWRSQQPQISAASADKVNATLQWQRDVTTKEAGP